MAKQGGFNLNGKSGIHRGGSARREALRKCLKCDKKFLSVGPHERICYYCREKIKMTGDNAGVNV